MENATQERQNDPQGAELIRAKSGKEMAKTKGVSFGKSDPRHWEGKIFKPVFTARDGSRQPAASYSVRIAYRGRRESFALGLANQREAAKRARDIYLSLLSDGWEAAVAQFKPDCRPAAVEAVQAVTVGDYIAAAASVAEISPRSLNDYSIMLRKIAAGIAGIEASTSRFGPRKGGSNEWRGKIDALPLSLLTAEAVQTWKLAYVKPAGSDPAKRRSAETSANSVLRQAKALFSKRIVSLLQNRLALPQPLPFAGVPFFKRQSARYLSKIDVEAIMADARTELAGDPARSEQWKIFVLAIFCGLRRREIDCLLWTQCDLRAAVVQIQETEYFKPKSADSTGEIDLDPEVAALLQGFYAKRNGSIFVIESDAMPRPASKFNFYRAAQHFDALAVWLKNKGITARKPLHELRKEAGSHVAKVHGLYGAQRFLRHASPQTTAGYYLDKKQRVTPGFGGLLSASADSNVAPFTAEGAAKQCIQREP